jgi:hypothetical protein
MQSLRAQGKQGQAAAIERRYREAWSRADVALTASRFMGEEKTALAGTEATRSDRKESSNR